MSVAVFIDGGGLALAQLRRIARAPAVVTLAPAARTRIEAANASLQRAAARGTPIYGVNTGFGLLAQTRIPPDHLRDLQRNLVLSHAAGTGPRLDDGIVRTVMVLKIAALARGHSGVRAAVVDLLADMLACELYPCVPAQGSVGASGDLAPLAHIAAAMIGEGWVRWRGREIPAAEGLARAGLAPLTLDPKEGLALVNGTQVSTALALHGLFAIEDVFAAAVVAGALSVDALKGSDVPFDARIHEVRGHPGQAAVAGAYRELIRGSAIRESHRGCGHVQDPYSLRCQPQVMGACLDALGYAGRTLAVEANAVTDNPLVFPAHDDVLSGGNFHAEPVALAADMMAIALTEIASLSERRTALLVNPRMSGLPAFLVADSGLNSGFMVAQVTAAALVSENKSLAHPASVDSIPTSADQEDHVSMATFAARRLAVMADNAAAVVGIELLAAAQGIEFHRPLVTSPALARALALVRGVVPAYERDRLMAPDIAAATALVQSATFVPFTSGLLPSCPE